MEDKLPDAGAETWPHDKRKELLNLDELSWNFLQLVRRRPHHLLVRIRLIMSSFV